jgi:hypothetical protein
MMGGNSLMIQCFPWLIAGETRLRAPIQFCFCDRRFGWRACPTEFALGWSFRIT